MAGIFSQGGSAGHRYAGWLSEVEAKNFQFGGKVFNGSPSAIYVGSNLVWWYWLKPATRQAIMDAFLDDGMAVIQATIAYLNQLAASGQAGKDKATALAGFINEDPMMVCSLGLEVEGVTMPIRWLVGSVSVADMNLNTFDWCKYKFKYNTSKYTSFGSRLGASGTSGLIVHAGYTSGNIVRTYMRPTSDWVTRFSNISPGVIYELEHNFANNVMILNGTSVALQWDRTALAAATMACGTDDSYMTSIETNDRIMALSIQNGVIGWVDTLTCNFHAGTGTIEYTRNGQPWTPSTP
jgi:hypothetical protein